MVHYPEKRFYPRNPCKLPATIEEVEDNFLYRARLVNYSNTGIFVETDVVLESGTEIVVGIEDSLFPFQPFAGKPEGIDASECYRARVIWQKGIEDSIFNYGYIITFCNLHDPFHVGRHAIEMNRNYGFWFVAFGKTIFYRRFKQIRTHIPGFRFTVYQNWCCPLVNNGIHSC